MTSHPPAPLDIYRMLEKSNCRRCQLPSCLAFAAAVVAGSKKPGDCPVLDRQTASQLQQSLQPRDERAPEQAEFIDHLERKVAAIDLAAKAQVIGGTYRDGVLTLNSLGKDFCVNRQGRLTSQCHIIPWVKAPLLSYITHPTHQNITGEWSLFRELKGGMEWQNLFTSRCENVLKGIADDHPDLFVDLIDLFMGQKTQAVGADVSLVLHPLPHFPLLISYQLADNDLESGLTLYFDRCCGENLHIKSIYTLCAGLVKMFAKIAQLHST